LRILSTDEDEMKKRMTDDETAAAFDANLAAKYESNIYTPHCVVSVTSVDVCPDASDSVSLSFGLLFHPLIALDTFARFFRDIVGQF